MNKDEIYITTSEYSIRGHGDVDVPYEETASYIIDKEIKEAKEAHAYANDMEGNKELEILYKNVYDVYSNVLLDTITKAVKDVYHRLIDEGYTIYTVDKILGCVLTESSFKKYECKSSIIEGVNQVELEDNLFATLVENITDKNQQVIILYLVSHAFLTSFLDNLDFNKYSVFHTIVNKV